MERIRKPFQGVKNIVRFNWHFYLISLLLIASVYTVNDLVFDHNIWGTMICLLVILSTFSTLLVSYYVYDLSDLYTFDWLKGFDRPADTIINVHAGFDEMPVPDNSADQVFLFFAAHEIRREEERIRFFYEVGRIIRSNGIVLVALSLSHLAFPVLLMGLLCITSSDELISTPFGRRIALGLGVFWAYASIVFLRIWA